MQARAQSWKGLYNLLEAFRERFELREQSSTSAGGGVAGRTNTALHLPNWFEDGAEYRLKKSLVRRTWGIIAFIEIEGTDLL